MCKIAHQLLRPGFRYGDSRIETYSRRWKQLPCKHGTRVESVGLHRETRRAAVALAGETDQRKDTSGEVAATPTDLPPSKSQRHMGRLQLQKAGCDWLDRTARGGDRRHYCPFDCRSQSRSAGEEARDSYPGSTRPERHSAYLDQKE